MWIKGRRGQRRRKATMTITLPLTISPIALALIRADALPTNSKAPSRARDRIYPWQHSSARPYLAHRSGSGACDISSAPAMPATSQDLDFFPFPGIQRPMKLKLLSWGHACTYVPAGGRITNSASPPPLSQRAHLSPSRSPYYRIRFPHAAHRAWAWR